MAATQWLPQQDKAKCYFQWCTEVYNHKDSKYQTDKELQTTAQKYNIIKQGKDTPRLQTNICPTKIRLSVTSSGAYKCIIPRVPKTRQIQTTAQKYKTTKQRLRNKMWSSKEKTPPWLQTSGCPTKIRLSFSLPNQLNHIIITASKKVITNNVSSALQLICSKIYSVIINRKKMVYVCMHKINLFIYSSISGWSCAW